MSDNLEDKERIAYLEGLVALQADALIDSNSLLAAAMHEPLEYAECESQINDNNKAISASAETVQAYRDKLTEPLRREVAMLLDVVQTYSFDHAQQLRSNTQATAQAYEQEVEARGAVKALEQKAVWIEYEQAGVHKDKNKFTEGYRQACSDIAGILNAELDDIRATSKKGEDYE